MDDKKYIISFTGAQSTGKSTLLNRLAIANVPKCLSDPSNVGFVGEITRSIARNYNLPINEKGGDMTQLLILADHIKNATFKHGHALEILDRCALDGFAYTKYLVNRGKTSLTMFNLAYQLMRDLLPNYELIFYTNPSDVDIEDDGERSTSIEFRNEIIKTYEDFIIPYVNDTHPGKVVWLRGTVEERLATIKEHVDKFDLPFKINI